MIFWNVGVYPSVGVGLGVELGIVELGVVLVEVGLVVVECFVVVVV